MNEWWEWWNKKKYEQQSKIKFFAIIIYLNRFLHKNCQQKRCDWCFGWLSVVKKKNVNYTFVNWNKIFIINIVFKIKNERMSEKKRDKNKNRINCPVKILMKILNIYMSKQLKFRAIVFFTSHICMTVCIIYSIFATVFVFVFFPFLFGWLSYKPRVIVWKAKAKIVNQLSCISHLPIQILIPILLKKKNT